jgi:uncharacterized tellurite resistance protein B-like protein
MDFSEIISLFKQGKGTAKSHMKNLIEMAAADGNFDDNEYGLLKTIAKRNGISEGQLKQIRQNPAGVQFELPSDKKEKFHQFYDLVNMMVADKSVHLDEQRLCSLFAVKFGYSKSHVDDLITAIRANIQNGQGHDETMKRVEMMIEPSAVSR